MKKALLSLGLVLAFLVPSWAQTGRLARMQWLVSGRTYSYGEGRKKSTITFHKTGAVSLDGKKIDGTIWEIEDETIRLHHAMGGPPVWFTEFECEDGGRLCIRDGAGYVYTCKTTEIK